MVVEVVKDIISPLNEILISHAPNRVVVITDERVKECCLGYITSAIEKYNPLIITTQGGEEHKDITSLTAIWHEMLSAQIHRNDIIINLGGGIITDMGGLAAALYKRGIKFINIPTTLLCAIDASYGGKTGVNFDNLKNQIGTFAHPIKTLIYPAFYTTLPPNELFNGYAEMIKHGLIASDQLLEKTYRFINDNGSFLSDEFYELIDENIAVKSSYIIADEQDNGIRNVLNFGHTIGHALEAFFIDTISHGRAVAWGMVGECYLSFIKQQFDKEQLISLHSFVKENYAPLNFTCKDYDKIYLAMLNDKKNDSQSITCTLLKTIGEPLIKQTITKEEVFTALDFIRDL